MLEIPDIESVISNYKPHTFGISKTYFKRNHDMADITIEDYDVFLAKTLNNPELYVSRIAVYVHKDLVKKKLRADLMTDYFSSVCLEVGLNGQKLY